MAALILRNSRFVIKNIFRNVAFSQRCVADDCHSPSKSRVISEPNSDEPFLSDVSSYLFGNDDDLMRTLATDMVVYENFLTIEEENSLIAELEPYLKKLRYEFDHWDNAIHGFRETEKSHWTNANKAILDRIRNLAFPPSVAQIKHVHVLDLAKDGYIKPHVDSVRFCGDTIAGLSLLSSCVMKLVHEKQQEKMADVLLPRRSLYIMRHTARYDYTHEVLPGNKSFFRGTPIPRERRISVICRNEPL